MNIKTSLQLLLNLLPACLREFVVCAPMFVSMYGFNHACFRVHMPVVTCAYVSGHAWAHARLWRASLWACVGACVHVCGHMCALV